jgi:hypothetical protein
MIVFDLLCAGGHCFEGWFGSAADFASQQEGRLLACPSCGSASVERLPSASRVNFGASEPEVPKAKPQEPQPALYARILEEMLAKSEDVGKAFPAEARKIFYEEAPARPIRGEATAEQHEELVDEGIPVLRLPVPPRLN